MRKLIFITLLIFLVACSGGSTEPTKVETELTPELKAEICREINIYADDCDAKGKSSQQCAEELAEKIPRVFELTAEQSIEAIGDCQIN